MLLNNGSWLSLLGWLSWLGGFGPNQPRKLNQPSQLLFLLIFAISPAFAAFDSSDYRQNTYGPPNHYCDPARALNNPGAGTLSDPWNMSQAAALVVPGDVVGFLPGVGRLPRSGSVRIPAFDARNSGTPTQRIVYVTKYAAVALPNVATNPNRTEMRHDGTPSVAQGQNDLGTGCPIYGSYFRSYVTFDGFFTDMAEAQPYTDSGVIRIENATGVHIKNFEIKGTRTNMQSNPIIYRPQGARDTVLSNFRVYDFFNDRTGSTTPQDGLFSDQYGDQNFLIEHFEIRNTQGGIFLKGSADGPTGTNNFNYGTIRYGIVQGNNSCFRFHALNPTQTTRVEYNLCIDAIGSATAVGMGLYISSELIPTDALLAHHNTIARFDSQSASSAGGIGSDRNGFGSNVIIRDNLVDINNGPHTHGVDFGAISSLPTTLNNNGYTKNGGALTWAFNGAEYNSLGAWQSVTSRDLNSQVLSGTLFVNRAGGDFHISAGHPAKTASSTGGELGAYAGTEVVGVDVGQGGNPPPSACDLDQNSSTSVIDVQLCANQAIGINPCTSGDINRDSACNVVDVQRVVNAALGNTCITQ